MYMSNLCGTEDQQMNQESHICRPCREMAIRSSSYIPAPLISPCLFHAKNWLLAKISWKECLRRCVLDQVPGSLQWHVTPHSYFLPLTFPTQRDCPISVSHTPWAVIFGLAGKCLRFGDPLLAASCLMKSSHQHTFRGECNSVKPISSLFVRSSNVQPVNFNQQASQPASQPAKLSSNQATKQPTSQGEAPAGASPQA